MNQQGRAGLRESLTRTRSWIIIDWSEENLQKLMVEVENFVPLYGQTEVKQMNILLLGQIGAGKSCIINTITSILGDYASHTAESRSGERSVTRNFRQYEVTSKKGKELPFRLCDTKGIEDGETIRNIDIQRMIDGEKLDMEPSEPSYDTSIGSKFLYWKDMLSGFVRWMKGWIWKAKVLDISKRASCVVYVIDSSSVEILPENVANYFIECRKLMKQNKGIPEIVLLTKTDVRCGDVKEDLKAISYSPSIKNVVQKVKEKFNFEENQIYPVVNMLVDVRPRNETSILFLTALKQMLYEGREHIKKLIRSESSGVHIV